ncbi:hypothetical protein DFR70_11973 [Nocardia tenerifensis]|uniref:DUF680 domain-containing protein n=1 Tax=Nocardia tenerifensis TaxID=228006 RepID=A0A318JP97_9NOCA|nr:hypothetical protein [Nocardia tenerifensis]PXX56521.1 hypothetical protein DFR70_11973 [Nocardia tenerifensis]
MKRIIAGTVFAAAIAGGVAIAAGSAAADNGVIHMEGTTAKAASGGSAAPDATAIEYGLARSGGGATASGQSH